MIAKEKNKSNLTHLARIIRELTLFSRCPPCEQRVIKARLEGEKKREFAFLKNK